MLNKSFFISIFVAAVIMNYPSFGYAELFGEGACDGSDPQGGVLLPKELVKRCGLCQQGEAELTEDCLTRLVFDYKEQPDQYRKEKEKILAEYNKDDFGFAVKNMVEAGSISDVLRKEAGYTEVPNISLNGEDNSGNNTKDKSLVEKCKQEQGEASSRCFMDASGSLTSRSVSLLLNVLRARSVVTRTEFIDNLFNDIVVSSDADTSDKSLMLPNQGI